MADIRIKDLAVTAGSSASDDYLAVDGSTNGTRKLSAYSPTFGGNLTVSGTSGVTSSGTVWGFLSNNATQNGYAFYASGASADQKYWHWQNGSAVGDGTLRLRALNDALTSGTNALIITRTGISSTAVEVGGNLTVSGTGTSSVAGTLLVATTTNSSNGAVQLATHTTSAGGIGFGADVSLYRQDGNTLVVQPTGSSKKVLLYGDGTNSGVFNALSSFEAVYFDSANHAVKLATNGFTALTLDSNQNATFAGSISASKSVAGSYDFSIRNTNAGSAFATVRIGNDTSSNASILYAFGSGWSTSGAYITSSAVWECTQTGGISIFANQASGAFRIYTGANTTARMTVKSDGKVNMSALPTSSVGLSTGDIWNDSGTLKIV